MSCFYLPSINCFYSNLYTAQVKVLSVCFKCFKEEEFLFDKVMFLIQIIMELVQWIKNLHPPKSICSKCIEFEIYSLIVWCSKCYNKMHYSSHVQTVVTVIGACFITPCNTNRKYSVSGMRIQFKFSKESKIQLHWFSINFCYYIYC